MTRDQPPQFLCSSAIFPRKFGLEKIERIIIATRSENGSSTSEQIARDTESEYPEVLINGSDVCYIQ
ncbi:hypothetical protein BM221_009455 [Beauveria bassiana]|uniref:Uncharacterized protein n=1 Tax=Beauveria bassiana TaxID=176275 RepID=A0A2N6NBF9_BEABA|nr:hypothetical protein BM221_009455 [Beauveria bassiana]